jgi:hypothetical protein
MQQIRAPRAALLTHPPEWNCIILAEERRTKLPN